MVTTSSGVRKEYLDLFELRAETVAELNRFVDEGTVVAGHRTTTEKRQIVDTEEAMEAWSS